MTDEDKYATLLAEHEQLKQHHVDLHARCRTLFASNQTLIKDNSYLRSSVPLYAHPRGPANSSEHVFKMNLSTEYRIREEKFSHEHGWWPYPPDTGPWHVGR